VGSRFDIEGKVISCDTVSNGQVFAEAVLVSRRGGGHLEKIAGARHPEVDAYLRTLKPDPRYQYVLMTPMGASEVWGRNINGDSFPELALSFNHLTEDRNARIRELVARFMAPLGAKIPDGTPIREFGYKTFEDALRYRHHLNKDPSIAYGDIDLSVWNPAMRRVEVIVRHWREKAAEVGASEIINDIDNGKPRSISMGCRVPFDVCTICGHLSKTTDEYCTHLKNQMGQVLPDGRVVAAINLFPRFFDLSDVIVPAASESGVIEKVAHQKGAAAFSKTSEIDKRVKPNAGPAQSDSAPVRAVLSASAAEPTLPSKVLEMGSFQSLLTTMAGLGIILKPHEFQLALLVRDPATQQAAGLLNMTGSCFQPCDCGDDEMDFDADDWDPGMARSLTGILPSRSGFPAYLHPRVVALAKTAAPKPRKLVRSPLLDKVAYIYATYRRGLEKSAAALVDSCVRRDPSFFAGEVASDALDHSFLKVAGSGLSQDLSECSYSVYVHNAYNRTGVEATLRLDPQSPAFPYLAS
jgi:hypothetical protein